MSETLKVKKSNKNGRLVASIILLVLSLAAFGVYCALFSGAVDVLSTDKAPETTETETETAETENEAGKELGEAIGKTFAFIFILIFMIIVGIVDVVLNIAGLITSATVIKAARKKRAPALELPVEETTAAESEAPAEDFGFGFSEQSAAEPINAATELPAEQEPVVVSEPAPRKQVNGRLIYGITATALSALMIVLTLVFFASILN